jgi:DUF35 OB-fold domain, acyl-CoA-associated
VAAVGRDLGAAGVAAAALPRGLGIHRQPPAVAGGLLAALRHRGGSAEEDDGVRLTTNIVGCPAADVRIGMAVRVVFEKAGGVYVPLFEPDPERAGQNLAIPADRDVGAPRARASAKKFEERVVLTGVGQSRVGRRLMTDPLRLTVDACLAAVDDAGLTLDDIDGLSTYSSRVGSPGFSEGGIAPVTEALQLRPTWINPLYSGGTS